MTGHSDPFDILRRVYLEGLRIDLVDGATPVVRGGAPSVELKADLSAHRQPIVEHLTRQRIGERDDGYAIPVPRRYVVPAGCLAERACARLGWCGDALMRKACDHAERDGLSAASVWKPRNEILRVQGAAK